MQFDDFNVRACCELSDYLDDTDALHRAALRYIISLSFATGCSEEIFESCLWTECDPDRLKDLKDGHIIAEYDMAASERTDLEKELYAEVYAYYSCHDESEKAAMDKNIYKKGRK